MQIKHKGTKRIKNLKKKSIRKKLINQCDCYYCTYHKFYSLSDRYIELKLRARKKFSKHFKRKIFNEFL